MNNKTSTLSGLDVWEAYKSAGLEGDLYFQMPDGSAAIEFEDGSTCTEPDVETYEELLDRIERSRIAGRNLFVEEWGIDDDDDDYVYGPGIVL